MEWTRRKKAEGDEINVLTCAFFLKIWCSSGRWKLCEKTIFISLCLTIFYLALRLQHYAAAMFEVLMWCVLYNLGSIWKTDLLAVMFVFTLASHCAEAGPGGNYKVTVNRCCYEYCLFTADRLRIKALISMEMWHKKNHIEHFVATPQEPE